MKKEERRRVYSRVPARTHELIERMARSSGLTISETLSFLIVVGLRTVLASQGTPAPGKAGGQAGDG